MRQEVINLLNKVQEMRSAQKRYFKSRKQNDLIESKRLEIEVDTATPAMLKALSPKNPD
jgi:hypothetical protein